jgi:hypothetical protein
MPRSFVRRPLALTVRVPCCALATGNDGIAGLLQGRVRPETVRGYRRRSPASSGMGAPGTTRSATQSREIDARMRRGAGAGSVFAKRAVEVVLDRGRGGDRS